MVTPPTSQFLHHPIIPHQFLASYITPSYLTTCLHPTSPHPTSPLACILHHPILPHHLPASYITPSYLTTCLHPTSPHPTSPLACILHHPILPHFTICSSPLLALHLMKVSSFPRDPWCGSEPKHEGRKSNSKNTERQTLLFQLPDVSIAVITRPLS